MSPNRVKDPFTNQPLNIVQLVDTKKPKKLAKLMKGDQENQADPSRICAVTSGQSIASHQVTLSAEKKPSNKAKARAIIAKNPEGFQKFGAMMGKTKSNMVRS